MIKLSPLANQHPVFLRAWCSYHPTTVSKHWRESKYWYVCNINM